MKPRTLLLGAAAGAAGLALAGAAGAVGYLRYEQRRDDPASSEDFGWLDDDLEHHTLTSYDGGKLHVVARGPRQARPLLLVHGVTLASGVWRYQLRDLAGPFRVLAIDQRGHGLSVAGREGFGLDRLARDLVSVLEGLDLHDAVVCGHSMGGFATQQLCIDHPHVVARRVAGIVLINTAAGGLLGHGRPAEWVAPIARRVVSASGRRPRRSVASLGYLGTRYTLGRGASPSHVRLTWELSDATDPETTAGSVAAFLDMDLVDRLGGVDVPALVVTGSHDRLTPPARARQIASHLPGARLVILPGCGHMSMLERHDELDRLISEFAADLAGADAAAH